jgi:hypothetical protein
MANKKINQLVSKTAILSTDIFGIGDATTGQLFKKTIAELQAAIGGAVISVNGLVGTVVLDTDDIQELATPTNKYFTDARARGAISLTVTGNSGASTYSSGTGVLNVPTYTLAGLGGISATFLSGTSGISYNSGTGVISYSGTVYTDASIRALLSAGTGISYNSTTGAISYSGTVYTDASVRALISITTTGDSGASTYNNTTGVINVPNYTLAGLGGISYTSLSGGTGITYNNTTGAISYSGTVYTDASVRALISATGNISYNSTTGVISTSLTQYTDALARASVSLTTTGTSGASTYNSTTGVFNIPQYQAVLTNPVTGTGTTNYHAKWTSSSAIGDSLIYDNGTNISIGNVSPSEKFEIQNGYLSTYHNVNSDGAGYGIQFYSNGGGSKNSLASITLNQVGSARTGELIFKTSNAGAPSTRLTIASTGQTTLSIASGIYTALNATSPNTSVYYQLSPTGGDSYILGAGVAETSDFCIRNATRSTNYFKILGGASGGAATFSNNITIGSSLTYAYIYGPSGQIYGSIGANSTWINSGTGGLFINNAADNASLGKVTNAGNFLFGTTTDNGERLYVSGAIRATGTITANSDISLKKNLLKIENALEKVEQINGYTYEFKEDDSKRHAGVIAQEIQTVLPEIVNKGNDGILGVEYGNISALLIEAIKEQNIKIKNLETLLASK